MISNHLSQQFETSITGVINYGDDWPTLDTDKMHDRPNLRALITTDDGENLELTATGIQTPNAELGAIITGTGKGALAFGSFQSGLPDPFSILRFDRSRLL